MTALLKRARELAEKATPGPWHWDDEWGEIRSPHECNGGCDLDSKEPFDVEWHQRPHRVLETDGGMYLPRDGDRAFIAASRKLVPELCDEVERLRALLIECGNVVATLNANIQGQQASGVRDAITYTICEDLIERIKDSALDKETP